MHFVETRGNDGTRPASVRFSQAILNPLASYGGLYVPQHLPRLGSDFLRRHLHQDYTSLAHAVLDSYAIDIDSAVLDRALARYKDFDDPACPVPVVRVRDDLFVSELYHGPTRAFKDMALQPFGVVLASLARERNENYLILAATSGDTGPATLETFRHCANIRVACLYPHGGTSDVQRLQMVTEDAANLKVLGIHGAFDDAQAALKQLLASASFNATLAAKDTRLSAANSVNFGRIIFQQVYHIHSYLELVRQGVITLGDKVYLNVPSGNFGNALGGYYAMKMGLPVEKILVSSNRNKVLTDWIRTGRYDLRNRNIVATSSPAMDILKSSNVERVLYDLYGPQRTRELMTRLDREHFYQLGAQELSALQGVFAADFANDDEVDAYIRETFARGYLMDPHTATCFKAQDSCREHACPGIVYSTAEWTKFAPTISRALCGVAGAHDRDALQAISQLADTPIPTPVSTLFDKPVVQGMVVGKADIERELLAFL